MAAVKILVRSAAPLVGLQDVRQLSPVQCARWLGQLVRGHRWSAQAHSGAMLSQASLKVEPVPREVLS